ncbi:MAG: TetR family transcriptional regulator [Parcubacteria group bacterium]|jgi:AcrR family transcriptional regulator|nr:TetR family transcriptional regulator [Parcubacteria group bacterium]
MNAMGKIKVTISPESPRKFAKEQTRQKAIDAAWYLFANNKYAEVTVRDIAQLMGKSTGAFFASFTSKEEAFAAVVTEGYAEYEKAATDYLAHHTVNDETIGKFVVRILGIDHENLERLNLLRTEMEISMTAKPEESLLNKRKQFLYDLLLSHYDQDRAVGLYLDFAWALHLDDCREAHALPVLGSRMGMIDRSLKSELSSL